MNSKQIDQFFANKAAWAWKYRAQLLSAAGGTALLLLVFGSPKTGETTKASSNPITPVASARSNIQTEENLLDDSKTHHLFIESATTTANSIGSQKTATIVVRCDKKNFDVYVVTPTYNGISFRERPTVSSRWDQESTKRQSWGASEGGDAFFSPSPKAFLANLVSSNSYTFGWTPYGKVETAVRFDLKDHKVDLKKMQELCS